MTGRFESFAWSLIAAAVGGCLLSALVEWNRLGRLAGDDSAPDPAIAGSRDGAPEARQNPAPGVSPGTGRSPQASPGGAEEERQTDGGEWERGGHRFASGIESASEESHTAITEGEAARPGHWRDLSADRQMESRGGLASGRFAELGEPVDGLASPGDEVSARSEEDGPRTEREFYESFLLLRRADARVLDALWPTVLDGPGPDCRKVAFLRAMYDTESAEVADAFLHAMTALPEEAPPGLASVPQFALDYLRGRAGRSAPARAALERAVWPLTGRALVPGRRSQAATALLTVASAEELGRLSSSILAERDPAVVAGLRVGLLANGSDPAFARALLDRLPAAEERGDEVEPTPPE